MISLIPNNGTEFSVKSGQKVIFEVPPDVGYVKGRDSYLTMDVKNTTSDNRRIGLSNVAGGQALINRIDIYSLKSGIHLETVENINQWCGTENQYFYEDTSNLTALEGCGEVVQAQIFNNETGSGALNGDLFPVGLGTTRVADTLLSPVTKSGTAVYQFRRYTIPIRAGLFRWWDEERLTPVLQMGGLRIVLTLEDPKRAFSDVLPIDVGVEEAEAVVFGMTKDVYNDDNSPSILVEAATGTNLWFSVDIENDPNNGDLVQFTGLADGNTLQVWSDAGNNTQEVTVGTFVKQIALGTALDLGNITAADTTVEVTGKTVAELAADGIGAGTWVLISGTGGADQTRVVDAAVQNATDVTLTLQGYNDVAQALPDSLTAATINLLTGVRGTASGAITARVDTDILINKGTWNPSALVRPELKVLSVVPSGMDVGKELNYQFTSYDMFLSTLPTASKRHQVEVPSVATRAVAITSNYVRVGSEDDNVSSGYLVCDAPSQTKLNEVQYYINNKLYPVRSYNPQEKEERIINQNENVKALSTINKEPKSLGGAKRKDLEKYTNTYIHSRELAREDFVFNLRDAETQIRLGFSDGRPVSSTDIKGGNRTIFTRVWSKKIVNISENGLRVIL
tara:strand:+ start:8324 stop:10195 length:1872 start_codon:yes stop_codon:yes gene_type:complete